MWVSVSVCPLFACNVPVCSCVRNALRCGPLFSGGPEPAAACASGPAAAGGHGTALP